MSDCTFFPLNDLRELMDPEFVNSKRINCIKHIRSMTGEGLKEAKDFFEQDSDQKWTWKKHMKSY